MLRRRIVAMSVAIVRYCIVSFMLHLAYKTNCYQCRTGVPSNKGKLVREPVKGEIKP